MREQPLGVALAWQRGHAVYIPLGHSPLEVPDGRPAAELLELMRPLFEDPLVRKLSARGKHDRIMLCEQGLGCESLGFDALVASYMLNPGRRQYTLERSEEHTSELQSRLHLVCRLLLEKKNSSPLFIS